MLYGNELIKSLENEMRLLEESLDERYNRIASGQTDMDDCFLSERVETRGIALCRDKIALLNAGGLAWFIEYATLDGTLVEAYWCDTRYGRKLRVEMPDGSVVWTTATTAKGLERQGLKKVHCLRPAWYCFRSSGKGLCGVYSGSYDLFPSDVNYATGEPAASDPIAVKDYVALRDF